VRIEFTEVDNGFIIVYRVLQKSRGFIKVRERFVKGKEY